jgi:probable DNA metabolism protein
MSREADHVAEAVACLHDGTFEGFLTAVFEIFRLRLPHATPAAQARHQIGLLESVRHLETDPAKADRVRAGIADRAGTEGLSMLRAALLSELPGIETNALRWLRRLFRPGDFSRGRDVLDPDTMALVQAAEAVRHEAHRFEGFVRFSRAPDGSLFAVLAPDHDILDLLGPHFRSRFSGESWSLFDSRRGRCVRQSPRGLESFVIDPAALPRDARGVGAAASDREGDVQSLWLAYYRATNIAERANPKLLARNLPRKYWRYLPERQGAGWVDAVGGRVPQAQRPSENAPPPSTM